MQLPTDQCRQVIALFIPQIFTNHELDFVFSAIITQVSPFSTRQIPLEIDAIEKGNGYTLSEHMGTVSKKNQQKVTHEIFEWPLTVSLWMETHGETVQFANKCERALCDRIVMRSHIVL